MSGTNLYNLIATAIRDRKQVTAVYDGRYREMCPHQLGRSKNGREQCLFYQFGGESNSRDIIVGAVDNWRCLPLDGLTDVALRDGEWHTASNYEHPATCLDTIDVEVGR